MSISLPSRQTQSIGILVNPTQSITHHHRLLYKPHPCKSSIHQASNIQFVKLILRGFLQRDFGTDFHQIPPHGRWRHFLVNDQDRITPLLDSWKSTQQDPLEPTRKMIDLFVVAVLMDAGAGDQWSFQEPNQPTEHQKGISRSEGLAIGTLYGFQNGFFSSDPSNPHQVDPVALKSLKVEQLAEMMQSRTGNQIVGLEGRTLLLNKLGNLLSTSSDFFPTQNQLSRPGNLIDYLMSHSDVTPLPKSVMKGEMIVPIEVLWNAVIDQHIGLGSIWPNEGREMVYNQFIGDVWKCKALEENHQTLQDGFVSFHKLSQWLTYSLIEV